MNAAALLEDVEAIARAAGEVLLGYYDRLESKQVKLKSSQRDLLTVADAEAEALVIDRIRARFPGHAILGEESGLSRGRDPWCWVVDPLDGTTNFARSLPSFAVSIGVLERGVPVAGVVYAPVLRECVGAAQASGCYLDGVRRRVSDRGELGRALLATGFSYNRNQVTNNNVETFANLVLDVHDIRRIGAASIDLAYVALGRLDGYWEPYLNPWDVAAGGLIVTEAGGQVSDYAGDQASVAWLWHENLLASNGLLHEPLRARLHPIDASYVPKHAVIGRELSG